MIGKLFGHTQVQNTQRYAHLLDDPLRAGLEQVGDMLRAKPRLVQKISISPVLAVNSFTSNMYCVVPEIDATKQPPRR